MVTKISADVADTIRTRRRELNLTIREVVSNAEKKLRKLEIETKFDSSLISRIEAKKIDSTSEDKLRAIALGLNYDDENYLLNIAERSSDIDLRICVVHAIFSSPFFAAMQKLELDGATITSFGLHGPGGRFRPILSFLSSNGARELRRLERPAAYEASAEERARATLANPSVKEGSIWQTTSWLAGESVHCSNAEIQELWRTEQIDIAIVPRETFKEHMGAGAHREAVACGSIGQSRLGAALVFLFDPEKWLRFESERKKLPDDPHGFQGFRLRIESAFYYAHQIPKENSGRRYVSVLCPKNTFVVDHVRELMVLATDQLLGAIPSKETRRIGVEEVEMSDYESFRRLVFDRAKAEGIVIVAIWEPFTTYLREDWEEAVRGCESQSEAAKSQLGEAAQCFLKDEYDRPDWIYYSMERSIGRLFNWQKALIVPGVMMDILISRQYLESLSARTEEKLLRLFERLERVIDDIQQNTAEYARAAMLARENRETFTESAATTGHIASTKAVARYFVGESIGTIASYFRISRERCVHALAEVDLRLSFERAFLKYLRRSQPRI